MGCGSSVATPESAKSAEIDKAIKEDFKESQKVAKVLLLGTGASGKTTVCKQMRLLYLNGYSDKDKQAFTVHICFAVLRNSSLLCQQAHAWGLEFSTEQSENARRVMALEVSAGMELDKEMGVVLRGLLKDNAAQQVLMRLNETEIDESYLYFMGRITELAQRTYVPSTEDILHCRVKTLGIVEQRFQFQGGEFVMVDVGGQRTERRKWIHAFSDVTLLLYVVSLADYDMLCEEDKKTNRLAESLALFEEVANNAFLGLVSLVVFFNKTDLLTPERLARAPFAKYHPDYAGPNDCPSVSAHIKKQFETRNKAKKEARSMYTHFTCATDTKQIEIVWKSVADVVLSANLQKVGFSMG